MSIKKVKICPKDKKIKPKDKKCVKCDFYNSRKWFSYGKEEEVFCTFDMNSKESGYIKNPHKALKKDKLDTKYKEDKK